jgi:hypothetical protein
MSLYLDEQRRRTQQFGGGNVHRVYRDLLAFDRDSVALRQFLAWCGRNCAYPCHMPKSRYPGNERQSEQQDNAFRDRLHGS